MNPFTLPPIHFSHANGFPARTYSYLFELLHPLKVGYINTLGLNENNQKHLPTLHWSSLTRELTTHISTYYSEPVVGIGHSFGAVVTFLAALERPDLFKQIILLDPPMFAPQKRVLMAIAYHLNITQYIPPASKAKNRRQHFNNLQEATHYFRSKPLFKNFHPKSFEAYITHALKYLPDSSAHQYTLTIPAALEYRVFCTAPYRLPSQTPCVPTYFLYADKSNVLGPNDIAFLSTRYAFEQMIAIEGGHLFPFEQPQKTATLIRELISGTAE